MANMGRKNVWEFKRKGQEEAKQRSEEERSGVVEVGVAVG